MKQLTLSTNVPLVIEPVPLLLTLKRLVQKRRRRPFGWAQNRELDAVGERCYWVLMTVLALSLIPYGFKLMPAWFEIPIRFLYHVFFGDLSLGN